MYFDAEKCASKFVSIMRAFKVVNILPSICHRKFHKEFGENNFSKLSEICIDLHTLGSSENVEFFGNIYETANVFQLLYNFFTLTFDSELMSNSVAV